MEKISGIYCIINTFLGKDIFEGVKVIPMTFESYPDQARGMIEEDIFLDHSCLER